MLKIFLAFLLNVYVCASLAQIYQWTDNQGVVHFSDTPHAGAKKLENLDVQTYSTPPVPSSVPSIQENIEDIDEKQKEYTKVAILQPKDKLTIRNPQGYVVVSALVEPALFPGDKVQVLLDDNVIGSPQEALIFQLSGIYRGTHTIEIQVVDSEGNVIKSSPFVTIYMQNPRVNMGKPSASL